MNPILQSQRDPRWANIELGFNSGTTIGTHGCTITAIGMKYGLTPDFINERMKAVGGYAGPKDAPDRKNLVIWKKLEEAIPGLKFSYRYYTYENEIVKQYLPCLVEVDATPIGGVRHWVLYVGNGQLYDPWDGKVKPTSSYKAVAFVVLEGQYIKPQPEQPKPQQPQSNDNIYKTLDLTNRESMKSVVDMWYAVNIEQTHVYLKKEDFEKEYIKRADVKTEIQTVEPESYIEMKNLGYNTIDDVNKKLKEKDDVNLALQVEISKVRNRNGTLAGMVQEIEEEDHTTAELGQSYVDKNAELQNTVNEIAKVAGVDKPTLTNIAQQFFRIKELADKFLERMEKDREQKATPQNPVKSDNIKMPEQSGASFLMQLFNLVPKKKGGE